MFRAVLDACVWYPNYLRDTLLRLAQAEFYEPLWSADILLELGRNLSKVIPDESVKRLILQMDTSFPDSAVTGYSMLIPEMKNDLKDRHVLAAAVRSESQAVVTRNLRDFPVAATDAYGIKVVHPDDFLLDVLDLAPPEVFAVLQAQVAGYRRAPHDVHGLLDRLSAGGVPQFSAEVRRRL